MANREEWYISQKYPSNDRAQALGMYCFGFVLVQEAGDLLTEDPVEHQHWELMLRMKKADAAEARKQFARFGAVIKLVDLGRGDLEPEMFP
jgi:hypothetical protein